MYRHPGVSRFPPTSTGPTTDEVPEQSSEGWTGCPLRSTLGPTGLVLTLQCLQVRLAPTPPTRRPRRRLCRPEGPPDLVEVRAGVTRSRSGPSPPVPPRGPDPRVRVHWPGGTGSGGRVIQGRTGLVRPTTQTLPLPGLSRVPEVETVTGPLVVRPGPVTPDAPRGCTHEG